MAACPTIISSEDPTFPEFQRPYTPITYQSCRGCADSQVTDNAYPLPDLVINNTPKVVVGRLSRQDFS
jgi:hypothetical protein